MTSPHFPQPLYVVRDTAGNIYGPAAIPLLRQWISENRIVAGMLIAPKGSQQWSDVASHPELADLFLGALPDPGAPALPPRETAPNPYAQIQPPGYPSPTSQPYPQPAPVPWDPQGTIGYSSVGSARQHPLGIASLICSCVAIPLNCCIIGCIGPVISAMLSITAIVLGSFAIVQIKANPEAYHGKGLAVTGICIGATLLLIKLVLLVGFIILMIASGRP